MLLALWELRGGGGEGEVAVGEAMVRDVGMLEGTWLMMVVWRRREIRLE